MTYAEAHPEEEVENSALVPELMVGMTAIPILSDCTLVNS